MSKYVAKTETELENILQNIENKCKNVCKYCTGDIIEVKNRKNVVICQNKLCKKRYNIYKDTVFYNTKIDKITIIKILEMFMTKMNNKMIMYYARIGKTALWKLFNKIKDTLVPRYYEDSEVLGGDNIVVQIDESKFGKRKYNVGHHVEGVWVLGMVEKTPLRRIKLVVVDNRKSDTLTTIIKDSVNQASTIHSDCWKGYNKISENFVLHQTVNHSKHFKDPVTCVNTNTIEGEWSGVKLQTPYRARTKTKVELYLVRYMIIRNDNSHPLDALLKYLF